MAIGAKRERVRIVRRVRTQDENGDYTVATSIVAERWASVAPIEGQEEAFAGQERATMRFKLGLDLYGVAPEPTDKVLWLTRGDLELNIREIRTAPVRNLDTVLICEAGVLNGATS